MPTNNKTGNIGLNAWLETDKPKRSDFVEDNQRIDAAISSHIADTSVHITAAQVEKLSKPFVTGVYGGDGTVQGVLLLSFTPSLVIFSRQGYPLTMQSGGETVVSGGFATATANSGGLQINGNKVYLTQTQGAATNGIRYALNELSGNYVYAAFK